eukprot:45942-Pelagomonas_calceolata.AAC.3
MVDSLFTPHDPLDTSAMLCTYLMPSTPHPMRIASARSGHASFGPSLRTSTNKRGYVSVLAQFEMLAKRGYAFWCQICNRYALQGVCTLICMPAFPVVPETNG